MGLALIGIAILAGSGWWAAKLWRDRRDRNQFETLRDAAFAVFGVHAGALFFTGAFDRPTWLLQAIVNSAVVLTLGLLGAAALVHQLERRAENRRRRALGQTQRRNLLPPAMWAGITFVLALVALSVYVLGVIYSATHWGRPTDDDFDPVSDTATSILAIGVLAIAGAAYVIQTARIRREMDRVRQADQEHIRRTGDRPDQP